MSKQVDEWEQEECDGGPGSEDGSADDSPLFVTSSHHLIAGGEPTYFAVPSTLFDPQDLPRVRDECEEVRRKRIMNRRAKLEEERRLMQFQRRLVLEERQQLRLVLRDFPSLASRLTTPLPLPPPYRMSPQVLHVDSDGSSLVPINRLADQLVSTSSERVGEQHQQEGSGFVRSMSSVSSAVASTVIEMLDYAWDLGHEDVFVHAREGPLHESEMHRLADSIIALCEEARPYPLFVRIASPVYVLGDLHGSFTELKFFLRLVVNFSHMNYSGSKLLFLGDYVDRGEHSVETAAYLLSLQLLSPNYIILLRGNHEFPELNGNMDDYDEDLPCLRMQARNLFGKTKGDAVWLAFNMAFKNLPLAADVDGRVFCAHGGIPREISCARKRFRFTDALLGKSGRSFPRLRSCFDVFDTRDHFMVDCMCMARDLVWSDPAGWPISSRLCMCMYERLTDDEEGLDENGFGRNMQRDRTGSSDIAMFGQVAVDRFLRDYGYDFIIRAHEMQEEGILLCKGARVITVFSCSAYVDDDNGSGLVFISDGTLRLVSVDYESDRKTTLRRTQSAKARMRRSMMAAVTTAVNDVRVPCVRTVVDSKGDEDAEIDGL